MSVISHGRHNTSLPLQSTVRAGFWIRALALGLDVLFIALLYAAVFMALAAANVYPTSAADVRWLAQMVFACIILTYTSLEVFCAASLGKLIFRLRIRRQDGNPAERWMLLLRWSTKQSPWILTLVMGVLPHPVFGWLQGLLEMILLCGTVPALNEDHLAWHDEWAGTAVWKVGRTGPPIPV